MNVLDLFSGIGGFSLGLERAGMRTVAFCEIDPYCRAVLRKHWPDVPVFGDVRELTVKVLADTNRACGNRDTQHEVCTGRNPAKPRLDIDVICGGFPCQDVSIAGKGAGITGERSGLWSEYARIIGEVRPRYVIVENVAALLGRGLERVLGDLAALGFDAEWHCIPASAIGAPHRRDRVWVVAHASEQGLQRCPGQGLSRTWGASIELPGGDWWLIEPGVGRVANGVPAELDFIGRLRNGEHGSQEGIAAADAVIGRVLRAMWINRKIAKTSPDQYADRLHRAVPEMPRQPAYSRWFMGLWSQEDQELCDLWEAFCSAPFEKTQDLQHNLLERIRPIERKQAMAFRRVDRLRALGNAIVPQIAEIIGRAIMSYDNWKTTNPDDRWLGPEPDDEYDADDDVTRSFEEAYRVIRERMANGGPGWTPK